MKLFEWLEDWRSKIIEGINGIIHEWSEKVFAWMKPKLIEDIKTEIALKSIKEEYFQTDEVKEIVRKLKEKWKHSPGSASDIAHDLLEGLVGKVAKLQLQGISGIKIDEETPYSQRLFDQLAILTDISLAAEIIGIIGEILSIGQIDRLGEEIRAYLDYSGLSQLAGYGYGMILSSVLSPVIEQEIRKKSPVIPIDVDRAVRLAFRKVLSDEEFKEICLKQGYDEKMQSYLKEAYKYYPSPTDFIRFAVRDVFREDIVKKYGYDNEWEKIEKGIREYVEKAGIDLNVLKWYWRAHWVLPSPQMAYEMLHRGIITQDDIRELLRISDYAPEWIEKLIAISYSPITRVDLRRLYQIGVIDEERLLRGYKELGYSEEDAKLMTEWTKLEYAQKDKDLTKTEILRNYRIGQCTREEAKKMLMELGYDEDEAEWILTYEDYRLYVEEIEAEAETIVYELSEGNITYDEAISKLSELNMPERVKIRYLNKAKREVRKTTKRPSTDDLKRWFKLDIIDEKSFREEMSKNKWSSKYIDNFIKEVKSKK
ncbi:MAG: hypothetical protein DRO11_08340 [Methanobacteriota archaeon]|nr:MAG: hypothetical protein DRO11_08340 [Euryarchaeota archaeon]